MALLGLISCGVDDVDDGTADPGQVAQRSQGIGSSGGPAPGSAQAYQAGEVLVRFKSGVAASRTAAVHASHAAQVLHEYRAPSSLQLVQVPQGVTVEDALAAYRSDPEVLYAEPNYVYELNVTPNDPSFSQLWGLHNTGQNGGTVGADINAPEAWDITTGSSSVVIGVLDSGVDYNHPDLSSNIFTNPGEIAGNGVDDDDNGWVDDVHGINTIAETGDPMDTNGHGTHVSGTIAARGNNGVGVAGVSWNAKIVACEAFNYSGAIADILQCMDYFLELKTRSTNPVDIVATNNSWGGGAFSQALSDAIEAHRQAGMLFVAAAGNNSSNNDAVPFYPATYDHANIVSVLATDHYDQRAYFSNYGARTVDVGAPGYEIYSTLPGSTYGFLSGTSMAAPHVTGLVGLLKAQNPSRSAAQIKNLILAGGTATQGTTDATLSGRRIRADGSLSCVNKTLIKRLAPAASSVGVPIGAPVPLSFLSITCDAPTSGSKVVTVLETGATITLLADGTGQFNGSFTPVTPGTSTLRFPNGDTVVVTAVRNYDAAETVPFEFPAITGTAVSMSHCYPYDLCSAPIQSPFPIRFGGAAQGPTTLHVTNKGFITFSATTSYYPYDNEPLPTASFNTVVAPFWDYFVLGYYGVGSVLYQVLGSAPSRQLVIEYRNVSRSTSTTSNTATFQVVFYEDSPDIRFNYSDVDLGTTSYNNGASATVGVQVAPGVARPFSYNTPSLSNGMSLLWTMNTPFASAGLDQVVLPSAAVALDGTASADFDGTIASYAWTQVAGSPVTLTGAATATPSFTAPASSGTLTFRLTVTDNDGKTGTDTVAVIVNKAPIAAAGNDFSAPTDLPTTLGGAGSHDPDGVITTYQWTQLEGAPVQLQNAGSPVATFLAPLTAGRLVFQLTVTDQYGFTGSDTVAVDVFLNLKPVASAGPDKIVRPGAPVALNGTASHDPDGTLASHAWSLVSCYTSGGSCAPVLAGANTATPSFTAPASPAIIQLSLTVTDNWGAVATDTVMISAFLQAPVAAIAAPTSCVQGGSTVSLNGTVSSDPDGTIAAYAWTQLSGPPVTLSGANAGIASFTAPVQGTFVFELLVSDSDGLTDTAQVSISIAPLPVANAIASEGVVSAGATVTLDGSQSTGAASYAWQQLEGPTASLSDASAASPTFVAPAPKGQYDVLRFKLTVTDACGITATDTVSLTVLRK